MSTRALFSTQKQSSTQVTPSISGVLQRKCACGTHTMSGECEDCKKKKGVLQRASFSSRGRGIGGEVPAIVDEVLRSPGQPLDPATRAFMEPKFGYEFSQVRVHTDAKAAESACAVNALAYTVGSHIAFSSGRYYPQSALGQQLLAHELAHVVQQSSGRVGTLPNHAHESEAAAAAAAIGDYGTTVSLTEASVVGIARSPQDTPAPVLRSSVTPEIEQQLIGELLSARSQAPAVESIAVEARRTFAVAAIIKPGGKITYVSAYYDRGLEHAEPQILGKIKNMIEQGDTVAIAIDQVPCSPKSKNCSALLKKFRIDPNHGSLRVFTVRALRRDVGPSVTPQTATKDQIVSPKTAITRELEERFLVEETEFRRIRLPLYRDQVPGSPRPPSSQPEAVPEGAVPKSPEGQPVPPKPPGQPEAVPEAAVPKSPEGQPVPPKPPTAAEPVPALRGAKPSARAIPGQAPRSAARLGAAKLGRAGLGVAKLVGPAILDALNRYYIAKAEAERASKLITARIESLEVQGRVSDLIEKERLAIARCQIRGTDAYVTVSLTLTFTNDVLNGLSLSRLAISDVDESRILISIMSHDPVFQTEEKVWYVDASLIIDQVPLSESEGIKLRLEKLEETAATPASMRAEEIASLNEERNRLREQLPKALAAEAQARKDEISRPGVISDPKERAKQQSEIRDQLQKLKEKTEPKRQAAPPGPQPLLPEPPPPAAQLLPGAPGPGLFEQAAQVVETARKWALQLEANGNALQAGVPSPTPPNQAERQAFFDEEAKWRLSVKFAMNHFKQNGREEAVNGLGELLDRVGPKLAQLRSNLGG